MKPLISALIGEMTEAFQTEDFLIPDTLHVIDPLYLNSSFIHELQNHSLDLVFDWYSKSKTDTFQTRRKEAAPQLKCTQLSLKEEYRENIKLIDRKRQHNLIELEKERKLSILKRKHKSRAKDIKAMEKKVQQLYGSN